GQGTTVVSPVAMAGAAAAVATGRQVFPRLIVDPAPVPAGTPAEGPELRAEAAAALRSMMRAVVTAGTAEPLGRFPGVHGKTGTAEFDSDDPSKTHAWFVGYQGNIAFAVFVENGGLSSTTAVPVAASFLEELAASGGAR
ncbi:MAG: penicillin-binding protein, partial [Dactylosporangium sp.]|nr:penicillin-binding protein [Dactylosporangium sp.]NNJ60173.1 penicillin-binding protein [Dactylosporangium sp.]